MKKIMKLSAGLFAVGIAISQVNAGSGKDGLSGKGGLVCDEVAASVTEAIAANPDEVLNIVTDFTSRYPDCSCDIVKSAILISRSQGTVVSEVVYTSEEGTTKTRKALEAERVLVGEIVYAAVMAAPSMWEIIAQCALAVAPDAADQINAALARAGFGTMGNPLDFPGGGETFTNSGSGLPIFPIQPNQNLKVVTDPGPPETSPHYNYPRWRFSLPIDFR